MKKSQQPTRQVAVEPSPVHGKSSHRPLAVRPLIAAVLASLSLGFAACSTQQVAEDDAGVETAVAALDENFRSPASERVIGGVIEMVLSNQAWPSFEAAKENRISEFRDGTPIYVHLRSNRKLGEIAHPADPGGPYAYSEYPHLFLQIGDSESLRILSTCYITLTPEEAKGRELIVPLAPLTYRPGQLPADCFLATVATGKPGGRIYEVRLAGFPGKFESWLPVPDLLAVAPIPTNFVSGAGEYASMLKQTPLSRVTTVASAAPVAGGTGAVSTAIPGAVVTPVSSSLVAASPLLPGTRQDLAGSRMETQLQALATTLLGRRPSETFFTDRNWTNVMDSRGRVTHQYASGVAVFKGASCSWQPLRVIRRPNATSVADVETLGDAVDVSCADLP